MQDVINYTVPVLEKHKLLSHSVSKNIVFGLLYFFIFIATFCILAFKRQLNSIQRRISLIVVPLWSVYIVCFADSTLRQVPF